VVAREGDGVLMMSPWVEEDGKPTPDFRASYRGNTI
jgi:hypothetical protein